MNMLVNPAATKATVQRDSAPTTKAHLRKLHTSLGTVVRANCGCGWTVSTTDPNLVEKVVGEAFEHRHTTGHVIDLHGILR